MAEDVVIVGAGHAAGQVVSTLKQQKFAGKITLLGEEPWLPYQRPPLSKKFLAGELDAGRLFVRPESFYADPQITVRLDTRVTAIDRDANSVIIEAGEELHYDTLILATGARARPLEVPGIDLPGIHYLRSIGDVERIRAVLEHGRRITIVGAGYIGLEVAAVARGFGLEVVVLEAADRVMSRVVSPLVSEFYADVHQQHGVDLRLSTSVAGFSGDQSVRSTATGGGDEILTDIVVVGVGAVPNVELAAAAGLEIDDGIVVDEFCHASDEKIYAVGDCTNHPNALLGRRLRLESVHNALEQAKTAAMGICGTAAPYAQIPWFWSDQYDLKLQIAGLSSGYDETVIRGDMSSHSFACVYLRDDRIIALDAVNRARDFMQGKQVIAANYDVDRSLLADPDVPLKDVGLDR